MNVLVEAKSTLSVPDIKQFVLPYNSWLSTETVETVEVGTINALTSYTLFEDVALNTPTTEQA
jgi:hypothetical protein